MPTRPSSPEDPGAARGRSTTRPARPTPRAPVLGCGQEEREDLRRALARLSERERAMLWLAYAEGASHKEIADSLGLRAGGIRVLLFRARKKLAAMLKGRGTRG